MNKLPKDIEPMFGLWVLFELKKYSEEYQTRILNEIENGIYPKKQKVINKTNNMIMDEIILGKLNRIEAKLDEVIAALHEYDDDQLHCEYSGLPSVKVYDEEIKSSQAVLNHIQFQSPHKH